MTILYTFPKFFKIFQNLGIFYELPKKQHELDPFRFGCEKVELDVLVSVPYNSYILFHACLHNMFIK